MYTTVSREMRSYEDHKKKNIGGKKSSGKGVLKLSTDAQSIAARERRHRISERFKILQSLVPGGSKMDTVSMLEEAINYVKFLKTQLWLHQNMIINFATDNNNNATDADTTTTTTTNGYFLIQNYNLPPPADHQITTVSADLLAAQSSNVVAEADALPLPPTQLGFPLQNAAYYSSYDQEILMAMPFDSNVFY